MRINGFFDTARFDAPYIMATVKIERFAKREIIKFLVDTGSSHTIIFDADAETLGIDTDLLKKEDKVGLGPGGELDLYILENPILIFITDKREQHAERFDKIYVVKRDKDSEEIFRLPSILGRDFLHRYLMLYRRSDNTLIITDEKGITIANCQGKTNIPLFQKVLNTFKIPYLAVYDKDSKRKENVEINEAIRKLAEEDNVGSFFVINPNFETVLGVSSSKAEEIGKPQACYQYLEKIENDKIHEDLRKLATTILS